MIASLLKQRPPVHWIMVFLRNAIKWCSSDSHGRTLYIVYWNRRTNRRTHVFAAVRGWICPVGEAYRCDFYLLIIDARELVVRMVVRARTPMPGDCRRDGGPLVGMVLGANLPTTVSPLSSCHCSHSCSAAHVGLSLQLSLITLLCPPPP